MVRVTHCKGTECALSPQMTSLKKVEQAVAQLQKRLATHDGVALRILECSLNCTSKHTEMPIFVNGHPRMREQCVDGELSRRLRPASLLRWDVPAVIFNAGRCTHPTNDERVLSVPVMTQDGYYPHGFVGHNVTSAGVGWIFRPVPRRKRGGAFGHDAWTFNFRLSGTNHNAKMVDRDPLESCRSNGAMAHSSQAYATARLASRQKLHGYAKGTVQQIAASFKWEFVNTSMNCWWPPNDWDRALADQQAFALLLAKEEETLAEECSIWGSLYNQVHVSWNASDIDAIFYVNDTLTARRSMKHPKALWRTAMAASRRAYVDALAAQRKINLKIGRLVPVVQYRVAEEECFDGRPVARRLTRSPTVSERDVPVVFHVPG